MRVATLGCKVNQYETELVRQGLTGDGYRDAGDGEAADLCVVNTCTVTNEGDVKSRQLIRRLHRSNPDARIVVMGCYATRDPDAVAKLPGVTDVLTDKRELPDLMMRQGVRTPPDGISRFPGRRRAYVKVQDGCLLRCSYCIIPHVRPSLNSRPVEAVVAEVRRLAEAGHREVVLTGIHLGHYGVEWNRHRPKDEWTRLSHLVRRLASLPGDFRIRLSSIEATEVTRELIDVIADHPDRICPHVHLCLQSGSDAVLRRMRRRWSSRTFLNRCELLRGRVDSDIAITTDVIVGFPGESDEDFQRTCEVSRRAGFSLIHVFPFSPRRGTPAAEMDGAVPREVRSERVDRLRRLSDELRTGYAERLVGRSAEVLIEDRRPMAGLNGSRGVAVSGTTQHYVTADVEGVDGRPGDLMTGQIYAAADGRVAIRPTGSRG